MKLLLRVAQLVLYLGFGSTALTGLLLGGSPLLGSSAVISRVILPCLEAFSEVSYSLIVMLSLITAKRV